MKMFNPSKKRPDLKLLLRCLAAICSGLLLFASFPPLEWAPMAWLALVPLLIVCASAPPREAAKWGLLSGLTFWLMSIWWISYVSFAGWIALCLYCAVYTAGFSFAASFWMHRRGTDSRIGNPSVLFVIPALWTGFEFVRSVLFSGFPWNQLGVSQFNNLALIQWAEWGGVYLVSYSIALVNTAIALTLIQYGSGFAARRYRPHPELLLSLTVLAASFWFGNGAMRRFKSTHGNLTVSAIQPNIPQTVKWDEEWIENIYSRLRSVTVAAITESAPDLVVWPETAVPDFVRDRGQASDLVDEMLIGGAPILVGSLDYAITDKGTNYYNSSFLFSPGGAQVQSYDKQHLVLFGEYIPLEGTLPFLKSLTPVGGSIRAGTTGTVFKLENSPHRFSVLICFEDTIARIARAMVRGGARLLINQTNDSWFDPSSASRQQMTHCVFRSVENRVSTVRATNTGVTCFIDRNGRVYGMLDVIGPYSSAPAYSTKAVFVADQDMPLTFYTRHGDIFAVTCLSVTVLVLALAIQAKRKASNKTGDAC